MKAAVCYEFSQPLRIEEVELAPPGPGEVEVRLAATAICHSDIHYIQSAWPIPLPAIFGHESAGIVERVGAGVSEARRARRRLAGALLRPLLLLRPGRAHPVRGPLPD